MENKRSRREANLWRMLADHMRWPEDDSRLRDLWRILERREYLQECLGGLLEESEFLTEAEDQARKKGWRRDAGRSVTTPRGISPASKVDSEGQQAAAECLWWRAWQRADVQRFWREYLPDVADIPGYEKRWLTTDEAEPWRPALHGVGARANMPMARALRQLIPALTETYPWSSELAFDFVCYGDAPAILSPIIGILPFNSPEYSARRITLEFDIHTNAKTIISVVRRLQREELGKENVPLELSSVRVFRFALRQWRQYGDVSFTELTVRWKRHCKESGESGPTTLSGFTKAFHAAEERLLGKRLNDWPTGRSRR